MVNQKMANQKMGSHLDNQKPLTGLAVAVTRPLRQNDALVKQLQASGADVTAIPLLAIEPLADTAQRQTIDQQLRELPDCQFSIFISQNAAEQALQALAERQLDWPTHIRAYAIGSATTAFLAAHGIPATSPSQMNSEGLLALPTLQDTRGQRCLIFRGLGGRETLADTLRRRGATVDYCELYRRTLPVNAATQWAQWIDGLQGRPATAFINSVETLRHLQLVDPHAVSRDNLALLVPGERVMNAATAIGFPRVGMACDATDHAMLDAIHHIAPSIGNRDDRH